MADIQSRVLARVVATSTPEVLARREPIALLPVEEAAEVMKSKPTRRVPVVLQGPHEAAPPFHEGWTIVPGSKSDHLKMELELRRRDLRNRLIREHLSEGRSVFYRPSGNSMWPPVQADDAGRKKEDKTRSQWVDGCVGAWMGKRGRERSVSAHGCN